MGPKARPIVLVSCDAHIEVRRLILAAPVTTRIRKIDSEVPLGPEDGLQKLCAANTSSIGLVAKTRLIRRIAALSAAKQDALDAALRFSLGLD
jgi:mRNA-degrading endonuclease toxin of MazEF toxin-antitoxin module